MDWSRMDLNNGLEQNGLEKNGFKEWIGAEEIQRMDRSRMDSKNGSEQNGSNNRYKFKSQSF